MSGDDEKTESMNDMLDSNEDEKEPLLASYESSFTSSRSPSPETHSESESESEPTDVKFTQPPMSRLKRTSLLLFFALLCWLAYSNLLHTKRKPEIVHASRYSKDYKFRPAASPVITEYLQDGRMRLRGALPEQTTPPPPVVKKKRKPKTGKASGKRKSGGTTKPKPRVVNQQRM